MKKLTTEEWINKAMTIHGNLYDYSKANYINSTTKIDIICKIHGLFSQNSHDHIQGKGCKECGKYNMGKRRDTIESFIQKANNVHNNFYSYLKTNYVKSKNKILITCPIHGDFLQTPSDHLQGKGCQVCGIIKNTINRTKEVNSFRQEANQVHFNYYDYSLVDYITTHTKVMIICPEHGKFEQSPNKHLKGQGCPKCIYKNQNKLFTKLKEVFTCDIYYEYSPSWLDKQRFDIYFPDYNIAVEYNGKQHYVPVLHFGGEIGFQNTQERDKLKRDKCIQNNCNLFEIKYDYNDNDYEDLINNIKLIIKSKSNEIH